ncbi:cytochrome-c peroxidase [Capsulimonas corticalis]|uniref:cytochrome-c peroxidase n=1 Tax=Capsulimonas corticalis TaxID=2219043 RepID=UPI000E659724|nr:cytochrome c peroxidase [Capsulimonas corticalis]
MLKTNKRLSLIVTALSTVVLGAALLVAGCGGGGGGGGETTTAEKAQVGKLLFNDRTLSSPSGQACSSCHVPTAAFADPRQDSPTSEGAVAGRFGKRQTPSIKYLVYSPKFHFDNDEQDYIGGQFWDGRAVDLKDQVHFPMLNAAEMNNATKADIVARVSNGPSAVRIRAIYGDNVFSNPDQAFDAIADAIATYESSSEVSPFTSKYDYYLKGRATLTASELRGLSLFKGKAVCNNCHLADPSADGTPPMFTDFTYDNIGLPRNPNNRFYSMPPALNPDGAAFADIGLEQTTHRTDDAGRFKVPTLRNIAVTGPYFHNGDMTSLTQAVQFYNKRDLGSFGAPEFPATMNREELGNLHLTDDEVADIVSFLNTLTDGYNPSTPSIAHA